MKITLTPPLLEFLLDQGYRYCFSKTTQLSYSQAQVCITLTPIKEKPSLRTLPVDADTFFALRREPVWMARGIDETIVLVKMPTAVLLPYVDFLLSRHTLSTYMYV